MTAPLGNMGGMSREQQERAMREQARREKARNNFGAFCQYIWPQFVMRPHRALIASTLDLVFKKKINRLIVNIAPQYGKTVMVSHYYPCYLLGNRPDTNIIMASYNADRAQTHSYMARNVLKDERFAKLFGNLSPYDVPVEIAPRSQSVKEWRLARPHRGTVKAAGVGGGITGYSANCFPGSARLTTNRGVRRIDDPCLLDPGMRVLAYDHEQQSAVWREVVAVQEKSADEFVEITTDGGTTVRATADHRFFDVERGYREAHLFGRGDRLITAGQARMPDMSGVEGPTFEDVPALLFPGQARNSEPYLHVLSYPVREVGVRTEAIDGERAEAPVLLDALLKSVSPITGAEVLSALWCQNVTAEREVVLHPRVLQGSDSSDVEQEAGDEAVSVVWTFSTEPRGKDAILFASMRELSTFDEDEGEGELTLQDWDELRKVVRRDETLSAGKGWFQMFRVPADAQALDSSVEGQEDFTFKLGDTSYRRATLEQSGGEPDNTLQDMPRDTPQVGSDTVRLVRRIRSVEVPVYDIQVAGTSNFFANGILAHNCLIIDDPVKDAASVASEIQREAMIEWYTSAALTRLSPDGSVILVQTRWHELDLAGYLLSQQDQGGDLWHILRLPAVAETPAQTRDWCNRNFITPDRFIVADYAAQQRIRMPQDDAE
jgi:hypothetical protein